MEQKLIFTENSPREQYEELYKLDMGSVFEIRSDYETVVRRIKEYKPQDLLFDVFPINPGTDLYTVYGPNHLVVTDNRMLLYPLNG